MYFLHSLSLRIPAFIICFILTISGLSLPVAAAQEYSTIPIETLRSARAGGDGGTSAAVAARTNELLVRLKPGVDSGKAAELHRQAGARRLSEIKKLGVTRVSVEGTAVDDALDFYLQSELVDFAELNYKRRATDFTPDDPFYADQWGLQRLGMGKAWEFAGSSLTPVKVAVLDTGIDLEHEDLKESLAKDPYNGGKILGKHFFIDAAGKQASDDNVSDNAGHGTHICGIVAAKTNNSVGIAGIASAAKIMPVKVLDDIGFGDDGSIAQGLIWAADNGARVINMSLAGPMPSKTLAEAVKYAQGKGALIVAATGNDGNGEPNYPAAYEAVIGVGAVDSKDVWISQSNFGQHVDVTAPGISILSTFPSSKSYDGQPYESRSGTSMATGFVSGLAALLLSINPSLSTERIEGIMAVAADDLGAAGWDHHYGHGRINAGKAVAMSANGVKPALTITSPANNTKISGSMLPVSANVTATAGVAFVEFYLNGVRQGTVTSAPYTFNIDTSDLYGKNTIRVRAYDCNGDTAGAEINCYRQTFSDVDIDHWAFEDIEVLAADEVLAGYPGGTFLPSKPVGRAEFVKMLMEALGFPKNTRYSGDFKDVPITHWAWPYIEAAYEMGIISGYGDNQFKPGAQIKRVEMAAMLLRSGIFPVDYSGAAFNDVSSGHWGFVAVMSARNASIINGYPGNTFKPEQAMSRAEAARVVKNSLY